MKITVHDTDGKTVTIPLPNALLFSSTVIKLYLRFGPGRSISIPMEAVKPLCAALKAYTRRHGSWELIHVESTSGNRVSIII